MPKLHKSFHQSEVKPIFPHGNNSGENPTPIPYLAFKTDDQSDSCVVRSSQRYFMSNDTFTNLRFLIPSPPHSFGRHTSTHFTQAIFNLLLAPPPQE
jgi:hypothetical protein